MAGELVIRDEKQYLATVQQVRDLAERIGTVDDARELGAQARAAEVWAQRAQLGQDKVNLAVVARLYAERRAGQLIAADPTISRGGPKSRGVTLPDGVSRMQSSRWQALAEIPADTFAEISDEATKAGRVSLAEVQRRWDRRAREQERDAREAELVAELDARGGTSWSVERSDLRDWYPCPLDAIITDPPYITDDAVELLEALRDLAVRQLVPGGALAVMLWQPLLPAAFRVFDVPGLEYRWTCAWISGSHENTVDHARRVFDRSKPVLVYHREAMPPDAPMLVDVIAGERHPHKDGHAWQQGLDSFRQLVRGLSRPGDIVGDPFLGAGTTALAAIAERRIFVGCDIDPAAIATTKRRLEA